MSNPRHAEILARIAADVVEQHRAQLYTTGQGQTTTDPEAGNVPVPNQDAELSAMDSAWHYRLPERWQG